MITTALTFVFAFACLSTFAFGARQEWKGARLVSVFVAILAFLLALLSVAIR